MSGSINDQHSKYKAAVGKRNVANDNVAERREAVKVSLGQNRRSSVTSAPSKRGGSWEGYMHGSSAPIQMNDSGYLAKGAQKARGMRIPTKLGVQTSNPVNRVGTISKNVFDYTYRSTPNSSMMRLKKAMRLNRLF